MLLGRQKKRQVGVDGCPGSPLWVEASLTYGDDVWSEPEDGAMTPSYDSGKSRARHGRAA
jgi:hypothetical protein